MNMFWHKLDDLLAEIKKYLETCLFVESWFCLILNYTHHSKERCNSRWRTKFTLVIQISNLIWILKDFRVWFRIETWEEERIFKTGEKYYFLFVWSNLRPNSTKLDETRRNIHKILINKIHIKIIEVQWVILFSQAQSKFIQ
jgi:hypothetical protein